MRYVEAAVIVALGIVAARIVYNFVVKPAA
jgi:hypothetical protein